MTKLVSYIRDSYEELVHKVTWPTLSELSRTAIIVLVASLVIALIVFLMDEVVENIMKVVYEALSGN